MTAKRAPRAKRWAPANLLTSVVLVLPLVIFYGTGVLFTETANGADLITRWLLIGLGRDGYLAVQGGLLLALLILALYLKRQQRFDWGQFLPVVLEASIYALTMGTLIVFVMVDLLSIDPRLGTGPLAQAGVFERLVMSAGAGVHEELVFRLVMMGGLLHLGQRGLGLKRWAALALAITLSSLLFSAAHHVGPLGDPLRLGVFVYRALAGTVFALLFHYRGFALAVYTHTLYDVYVLLIRA